MDLSNFSLLNILNQNIIQYIYNNIHTLKCGKIISKTTNEQGFNVYVVNINSTIQQHDTTNNKILQSKIDNIECLAFQTSNNYIEYKINDLVEVGFFDDNENIFLQNGQEKFINNNTITNKHCLANGIILRKIKLDKDNDNEKPIIIIDRINDKITLQTNNSIISIDDKIEIKNITTDLKQTLNSIVKVFDTLKTILNGGTSPTGPVLFPALSTLDVPMQQANTNIDNLLK